MYPLLKPALRPVWRDARTLQFGIAPAHAVVLSPVAPATGRVLSLMDGTRGLSLLRRDAAGLGFPPEQVGPLVERLSAAGLLEDAGPAGEDTLLLRQRPSARRSTGTEHGPEPRHGPGPRRRPAPEARLGPDLASLSVTRRKPGDPMRLMAARRAARVHVRGAGRVGTLIAAVLAAAGVGQVEVIDGGCVRPGDLGPGGMTETGIGRRRSEAARQAVSRAAAHRPRRAPARATGPEPPLALAVIAPRDGLHSYVPREAPADDYMRSGTPHLYAGVLEATGIVGPLVLPGRTACAGCLRRHRTDRDPTWPRLLAQWFSGGSRRDQACDVALATTVAGLAAAHALAFLDGHEAAARSVRWEASLPGLDWHARQLRPHRECSCGAAREGVRERKGEHTSNDVHRQETMAKSPPYAAQQSGTWRAYV
ncbi:ThiF family adenylyltransferase [Streptomyces sp. NA04227]|uniref:ThiF family adenylyltransferase n=1 Tax=Streptomyces sp. NA04227 TaxID=2742136 RepID=UPI0015906C89|nr:ThiF family adenylyltransferase [Streptomyces sp. NA04227]QKW09027.1 ThiF family adenylyltransferase [Streptomyces sp. NA04227]